MQKRRNQLVMIIIMILLNQLLRSLRNKIRATKEIQRAQILAVFQLVFHNQEGTPLLMLVILMQDQGTNLVEKINLSNVDPR